jgi:hypothetical protein
VTDLDKISGVKSYLRRTKAVAELQTLADAAFLSASEEVTITSISGDGTASSGQVSFPKWLLLQALEELIAELDPTPASARQFADIVDRSRYHAAL